MVFSSNRITPCNAIGWVLFFIAVTYCLQACEVNEACVKYAHENYLETSTDTSLLNDAFEYWDYLLDKFGNTPLKGQPNDAYQLHYYSAHSFGQSVKFEKIRKTCWLTVKCIRKEEMNPDCKPYRIKILPEEWEVLENMIYEFDFWTAEAIRSNPDVLDGFGLILEGNRPQAGMCGKKTNKLMLRGSPHFDKMGSLCDNIFAYEAVLKFKYQQLGLVEE